MQGADALLQFGSLPDHLTRKNMELLAPEVFPYVRKYANAEFGRRSEARNNNEEQL